MATNPILNDKRWSSFAGPGYVGAQAAARPVGMSIGGTALSTAVLLVLVCVAGAWGFGQIVLEPVRAIDQYGEPETLYQAAIPGWFWLALLGGLGLGLVTAFVPRISPVTGPLYALCYGVAVGGISKIYEFEFDGIVLQAVLATIATFLVVLGLYVFRIIRATRRLILIIVAATGGIFLMYLIAIVASLFGADLYFWNQPSPLGIAVSVGICIVAAMNLIIDFAFIESAVEAGAPRYMNWYGAYGVTVTLIWLYLSILRLLALLSRR